MERQIAAIRVVRDLIARPPGETAAGLRQALAELARLLEIGRCWLFLPDGSGAFSPGEGDAPVGTAQDLLAAVPSAMVIDGPDRLAAPGLRACLAAQGAGRCALSPLVREDALVGLLCLETPAGTPDCRSLELAAECVALLGEAMARARQDARRAETAARLEATLEAMPDLLFEIDGRGHYTGFLSGPRNKLLLKPEDFIGREVGEVLPPDVAEIAREAVRRVLKDGEVSDITYDIDLPDGRHSYEVRGARKPVSGPGAEPTAIFLVRDITREQALREELRRLGSVTRAMSNLVVIVDTELRVTWINPAFERQTGWTLDEISGRRITDLVRCEESDPEVVAAVARAIEEVRPFSGQMINKDRHGGRYHVDFNILPLRGTDGRLQGFVSVETIVTQMKEQKIALERLAREAAAAQNRLENALNALPDSMLIFDADRRLVISNPAYRHAFERLADILQPGLPLPDLLRIAMERGYFDGPEDPAELASFLESLMQPYRQASYSDEFQLKDGRWFRRVNKQTADGGLVTAMIDITARQRHMAELDNANEQLWRSLEQRELAEQRLSSIMDATRVGTWTLDLGTHEMSACEHWARIIGLEGPLVLSHAEFLGLVHPEDRPMLQDDTPRQATAISADVFEHEFRMRHREGHWVWVLSRARIIRRDPEDRPVLFDGVDIDISELKRLEMEVRQSDALLKSALESNVAAVAIYGSDDVLLYCNPEAERMLKLKPGLLYGRQTEGPVWTMERLDGQRVTSEDGPCSLARRAGKLLRGLRFAIRWPDGRRQVLTCNATPFAAGDGQTHTAVSFWDSTEELAVTERLQEALANAEAVSRSKSIFLANMSHEIRTPLNGVLGLAEVLSLQIRDPEQSRMIATIRRSGETLLSVLNTILDMSKIEAGRIELERVPLRLIDILKQVEAVYSVLAEEKGLEFEVITSAGADLPRIGDPHRIQQILGNLLSNAIKFSSEGGVTLTVSCRRGKPVVFSVADTGIGMTQDQCARVFTSFEQADETVSRRFGGTGLGLSIVRELVHLIGGTIELESEPGAGTTVRVTLPLPLAETGIGAISPSGPRGSADRVPATTMPHSDHDISRNEPKG